MVIGSLCVCMFVLGSVIMKLVVWITTCFLFWPAPPSRFQFKHENCVYVCVFGSVIMKLVVWITACFLFWPAPPPGFNLSMTTVCMCFVWFSNYDTCCLNYSMFFGSDPPPLQVSILAWKLIPRKRKETCWRTIPKLKSKKGLLHFSAKMKLYIIFKNQTITIKEQRFWTVTKCHACHAKQGYPALETSKSDHFCRTRRRHGNTGLTRPPANGCGRLRP